MDEGSYWSRVCRLFRLLDPRLCLLTDADIRRAQARRRRTQDDQVVVEAVVHPDTGLPIRRPFSMPFIVPCNMTIDALMLVAARHGVFASMAAQLINQTYNAAHYYENRNATNAGERTRETVEGFLGAIAGSFASILALHRLPPHPLYSSFIPFAAVAAADVINLGTVRRREYLSGIQVRDRDGHVLGLSRIAGAAAVASCIAGRVLVLVPILGLPPVAMHALDRTEWFKRHPRWRIPVLVGMVGVAIQVSVPLVFALFQQKASIDVGYLEGEFSGRCHADGSPVDRVHYNKGI
ncbi:Sideroflexin protein [Plasmodiophora brassicae]